MTPMSHPSPPLADFRPESMIDSSPLALLKPQKRRRHDFQEPSGSRLPILLSVADIHLPHGRAAPCRTFCRFP
jgi:hypothetical protein